MKEPDSREYIQDASIYRAFWNGQNESMVKERRIVIIWGYDEGKQGIYQEGA